MSDDHNNLGFTIKNFFDKLTNKKAIVIIFVIGFIVFFNGLFNNFVGDDIPHIVENPNVHSLRNVLTFFGGSTFYNAGGQLAGLYYRPISTTLYSFIYSLFGSGPFWFHLVQIFLHILNSCLLFFFLKHFFKITVSLALSLIFLIHPINSEAVFYIATYSVSLYFLFGTLSLLVLTKARSYRHLLFSSALLFMSLLSNEAGILFVGSGVAYLFIFNRKFFLAFLAMLTPAVVVYAALRTSAVGLFVNPMGSPIAQLSLPGRLLNIPAIFMSYLKTFLFPLNLVHTQFWAYQEITFVNFVLPLMLLLLFMLVTFLFGFILYKKNLRLLFKYYVFFSFWFLTGMAMQLQILPLDQTVADHWFYYPIVGILGMAAIFIGQIRPGIKHRSLFLGLALGLFLAFFSIRTINRSFDWKNDLTLATSDNKIRPSYMSEGAIGNLLRKQGQLQEAKTRLEKSVELYPYMINLNNLALTYASLGDYQKAKETYLKALEFGDWYIVYENLAGLSMYYGDPKESIEFIKIALEKFPQDYKLWLYLAILEYQYGDKEIAKSAITNAFSYSENEETTFVYTKIINNQPLKLNFRIENVNVQDKK